MTSENTAEAMLEEIRCREICGCESKHSERCNDVGFLLDHIDTLTREVERANAEVSRLQEVQDMFDGGRAAEAINVAADRTEAAEAQLARVTGLLRRIHPSWGFWSLTDRGAEDEINEVLGYAASRMGEGRRK